MLWSNIWLLRFNAEVMRIGNSPAVTYTMTDGATTNLSIVLEVIKEAKERSTQSIYMLVVLYNMFEQLHLE